MRKHILRITLITMLVYAMFAFINWASNPALWGVGGRFGLVMAWVIIIGIYIAIVTESKEKP